MIDTILLFSVRQRWLVMIGVLLMAGLGVWNFMRLPIDAVPDIFAAMMNGEANATVELTPNMAGPAFDALDAFKVGKQVAIAD